MTNINFDSNQMEKEFIGLYKSGELTFEKFDEYTKNLIKTTKEMHEKEEETKQKIKEEETKLKQEETKQKFKEYDTRLATSNNMAKNVERVSKAAIEWNQTLRPILAVALLLFEGGKELYNQMCKKPEESTTNNVK